MALISNTFTYKVFLSTYFTLQRLLDSILCSTFAPPTIGQRNLHTTKMTYKLLVLDVDGTLTNSKKEISPSTLRAIKAAEERGVRVILATGRPTYGVAPIADKLHVEQRAEYVLSFNGGVITEWNSKNVIYECELPHDSIPYLYDKAKENHVSIMTYKDNYVVSENTEDPYVQIELSLNHMNPKKVENFIKETDFPLPKCIITGIPSTIERLEKEIGKDWNEQLSVYRSEPFFLEIMPKGVDKATSLSILLKNLNIDRKEMIACGDGYNDIPMLRFAGLSVAMANAQRPVLEMADYITSSNDEEGVKKVIDKFIQ